MGSAFGCWLEFFRINTIDDDDMRSAIEAKALVTSRIKPLRVSGRMVEQVGLPWHFGFNGLATGGSANMLTTAVGDANTTIPEYKAFLCNIVKGGLKS